MHGPGENSSGTEQLLIVTGTMGAGKTAVLAEASDILAQRNIVHAAIDMDALGVARFSSAEQNDELMFRNLVCVCRNCGEAGIGRILLACAVENRLVLERICGIARAGRTIVCRLTAGIEEMERRVTARETGMLQSELVARVTILNALVESAALEDFVVINENRNITDVACEMLRKAGWI